MVKWEGYSRNMQCHLAALDKAPDGSDLGLKLLPYANGDPAPVFFTNDMFDVEHDPLDEANEAEEDEEEAEPDAPPPDVIEAHGQEWVKRMPQYVKVDARGKPNDKPALNRGDLKLDTIDALFHFLLPDSWIDECLRYTNPKLQGVTPVDAKLDKGELLRWWGYVLSITIHKGVTLDKMWGTTPSAEDILPPPRMGRHGMSLKRFKKIMSVIAFGPSDVATLRDKPWAFVSPLVDGYNVHMISAVVAGYLLTVDESIFAWRGKVGMGPDKCPNRVYLSRKPEPLGPEIKNLGCAQSGMILQMEIELKKADHKTQKFFDLKASNGDPYGHTTACTLRLAEPWFGSGRILCGDAWFASIKTCEALAQRGMYFIGDIKMGTRRFPKVDLEAETGTERGAWAVRTSTIKLGGDETMPIFSVTHRRGEKVHSWVASCGTTLPGGAHNATFEEEEERADFNLEDLYEIERKCPSVLNTFTLAQPCIDRHNRYRQNLLAMEKRILARSFSTRFGVSMMGTVMVNAFFAHKYFNKCALDFKDVMATLAFRLMHNAYLPQPEISPRKGSCAGRGSPCTSDSSFGCGHTLVLLRKLPGFKGSGAHKQQRCVWCNRATVWVCGECTEDMGSLVPLCPEESNHRGKLTHHPCAAKHRADPMVYPKGKHHAKRRRAPEEGDEIGEEDYESDNDDDGGL